MDPKDNRMADIVSSQSKLEAIVEGLAQQVSAVVNDIKQLAEYNRLKAQTNWGTIFAGVTLTVLLVTGYVGLPLKSLSERVDRLTSTTYNEALSLSDDIRGNSRLTENRLDSLDRSTEAIKQRLQAIERQVFSLKVQPEYWDYE